MNLASLVDKIYSNRDKLQSSSRKSRIFQQINESLLGVLTHRVINGSLFRGHTDRVCTNRLLVLTVCSGSSQGDQNSV